MERDLEVTKQSVHSAGEDSQPYPLGGLSRRPGVLIQSSKASIMPRKVSGGTAVSQLILQALAVTIWDAVRVPRAPSHTEEPPTCDSRSGTGKGTKGLSTKVHRQCGQRCKNTLWGIPEN